MTRTHSHVPPLSWNTRRFRGKIPLICLFLAFCSHQYPGEATGSPGTRAAAALSDSLYALHHPRLMFTRGELPALIIKVRDGGRDDDAYSLARFFMTAVYEGSTEEEMLGYDVGIGEFPVLGVVAFFETTRDTAAVNLGRRLTRYLAANYAPDDNVFYSPLRLRSLSLGYDMFFEDAPETERETIRNEIEAYIDTMLTSRQYTYWKHRPFVSNISAMIASPLGLAAICLDGETGPERVSAALASADDYVAVWLDYLLDPQGSYKEGAMYAGWSMRHLCYYFWARKRYDGRDYSANTAVRNIEKWVAFSLLPFGNAQVNNINDTASLNHPYSRHHTYFDWAQTEWNSGLSAWLWERLRGPTYGFDAGTLADPGGTALWGQNIAPAHPSEVLPNHFLWEDRGLYYFRTGWPEGQVSDDVVFSFYSGKFQGGHSQEDQNNFTLYGYGTRLAIDHGYGMPGRDSEAHNMMFIDGMGQHFSRGSVGTDGRMTEHLLGDFADYLFGDATEAYTTYSEFNRPGFPFPENDWSFGYDGGNPVDHAFRRFIVVHAPGTPPYFVLFDDVQKDDSLRTYGWRMHTDQSNNVDLSANPVQIYGATGGMSLYVVSPEFPLIDTQLDSLDNGHDDPNSSLISLSVTAAEAGFVIVLFPADETTPQPVFAHESLPWGEAFELEWPDGTTDLFLNNRADSTITFSYLTFQRRRSGPTGMMAPGSGPDAYVTDARTALIRTTSTGLSNHLLTGVNALAVDGKTYVEIGGSPMNVSWAGTCVEVDRIGDNFRFYAPGAGQVRYRGQIVPTEFENGYLVSNRSLQGGGKTYLNVKSVRAYPNPFNATTHIQVAAENGAYLTVSIYDTRGRLVRRVWTGMADTGSKTLLWSGTNEAGERVASGVYLVKASSGTHTKTAKIVVVR